MNATEARSSATLLVRIFTQVSLRRIGRSRKRMPSSEPRVLLADDSGGQLQELGADRQPGAARGVGVDLEAHLVAFAMEADHPTPFREAVHFADGQHARPIQDLQNLGQTGLFR